MLDFATIQQRNPLDNTLRFTLLFDFEAFNLAESIYTD